MSRNPKIEAILRAWWDFDYPDQPGKRAENQRILYAAIDSVINSAPFSRDQVLDQLWGQYTDFKIAKRREGRTQVAQSSLNPKQKGPA